MKEMEKTVSLQKEPYILGTATNVLDHKEPIQQDNLPQDNLIDTGKYARRNQKVR